MKCFKTFIFYYFLFSLLLSPTLSNFRRFRKRSKRSNKGDRLSGVKVTEEEDVKLDEDGNIIKSKISTRSEPIRKSPRKRVWPDSFMNEWRVKPRINMWDHKYKSEKVKDSAAISHLERMFSNSAYAKYNDPKEIEKKRWNENCTNQCRLCDGEKCGRVCCTKGQCKNKECRYPEIIRVPTCTDDLPFYKLCGTGIHSFLYTPKMQDYVDYNKEQREIEKKKYANLKYINEDIQYNNLNVPPSSGGFGFSGTLISPTDLSSPVVRRQQAEMKEKVKKMEDEKKELMRLNNLKAQSMAEGYMRGVQMGLMQNQAMSQYPVLMNQFSNNAMISKAQFDALEKIENKDNGKELSKMDKINDIYKDNVQRK